MPEPPASTPTTALPPTIPPALFGHLQTADDVAHFLKLPRGALLYTLYKAGDAARYRRFEIPKKGGGMRLISAPRGLVRDAQQALLPHLANVYSAHPAAQGFLKGRSVCTNAEGHIGQHLVFNVDLKDFFPSINFGRVRGLFMKPPFGMGAGAASVLAQICTDRNGLPQGAPTSPVLSNMIAASLDRRLARLARENRLRFSRYADDITFSSKESVFPPAIAVKELGPANANVAAGPALADAIAASGFAINTRKVRLQSRHTQQSVTGLIVNEKANFERTRIRKLRAMIHAWEKFGLEAAAREHFTRYHAKPKGGMPPRPDRAFRNAVYGQLAYIKMVRGKGDPLFLKYCARLIDLDPNPSRFIRQMVFGANDFDVFISHASEDKGTIARPIYNACVKIGVKAFLDEEHIAWGESFTKKINVALGSARTVLAIVSTHSVSKDWPLAEINTALSMEVSGHKSVLPLMVGKPNLQHLPLIRGKNHMVWSGDAMAVARRLKDLSKPRKRGAIAVTQSPGTSFWKRLFGGDKKS